MITSKPLDEKFKELKELLVSDKAEQIRARRGVPFIILLYPPEEELQVRSRIDILKRKLETTGWNIQSFQPEPILFKFLESKGKLKDVFDEDETHSNGEEETLIGKRIPILTETFLEELSIKMEIHPISIYWLLKEIREKEGVVCWSECKRYVEDCFTIMILRMLGFRWPKQVEANEPVPEWADKDGIIPITEHTGEKTSLECIRDRIGAEFGEDRIGAIETEFADILYNAACKEAEVKGKKLPRKRITLAEWLEREFFKNTTQASSGSVQLPGTYPVQMEHSRRSCFTINYQGIS